MRGIFIKSLNFLFIISSFCLIFFSPPQAYSASRDEIALEVTQAALISASDTIKPSAPLNVGLHLTLSPGWHTYTETPGDAGIPTTITWTLPEGFSASPIHWPPHETFKEGTLTTYGYKDEVLLPVTITPPASLAPDATHTLTAKAEWLVCKEICIPEFATLTLTLPTGDGAPNASADLIAEWKSSSGAADASKEQQAMLDAGKSGPVRESFLGALFFAFLGGIILNLMPCVFPVLSLKAIAIARQSAVDAAHARQEGIAYTLGIILSFALIAGALLILRSGGEAIGWGYQMQSPVFVACLTYLMFMIGLNLSGVFELPVLLGHVGRELTHEPTVKGSFFTGMLATLVATPCTAPFMAGAVGYALAEPAHVALAIFLSLALGLALPFLLISFFPGLRAMLPKPGRWMETFRQLLAFPIYASAIWLVWVLTAQTGANGAAILLLGLMGIIFVLWLRRCFTPGSPRYRWIALLLFVFIGAASLSALSSLARNSEDDAASPLARHGEPYTPERLSELRDAGIPVFIDATATWCITCQINWQSTLGTEHIRETFAAKGVTLLIADWTSRDPDITALLQQFGRSGVPLYLYYPANGEPKVLPQILTPQIVLDALE